MSDPLLAMLGVHDDLCASHFGHECNCPLAVMADEPDDFDPFDFYEEAKGG